MPYDITKLTNLGQMKQALQRMLQEIENAKSERTVVTIEANSWQSYSSGIYRSPSILNTANYNYYDVHLVADTSASISTMCANADIKAAINNYQMYLFCYGELPDQDFDVEIIRTPIDTNTQGLTYDIGDDYLVYPAITDAISDRVSDLEDSTTLLTLFAQDISIATNRWEASGNSTYPYKAVINMQNVTSDYFPVVQFQDSDTLLYDFSTTASSGNNTVTIYCKTSPSTIINIPTIICYKGTAVTAN